MAEDKKISQIGRQQPLLTDLVVAARDNAGNPINLTFTLADLLASITGSPFKVFSTDASYSTEEVEGVINSIIEDDRLIGKSGYPVYSTQLNIEFRATDLVYDAVNGSVTIKDFELQENEHLSIYPTVAFGQPVDYAEQINTLQETVNALQETVTNQQEVIQDLEIFAAPFSVSNEEGVSGAMIFWNKPAILIPNGWEEVTDWRGRLPIGVSLSDSDFNEVGKIGGAKNKTLSISEMPPHRHGPGSNFGKGDGLASSGGVAVDRAGTSGGFSENEWTASKGGGQAFSLLNPYRTVYFIRRKAA